jgi:MYXO-CTERM domain-containing protein
MRVDMRGALAAVVLVLAATSTSAWACNMEGILVCENDASLLVGGRQVTFEQLTGDPCDPTTRVLTSSSTEGATYATFGTDVCWNTSWNVTYFGTLTCGDTGRNYLGTVLVPSTDPACSGDGGGADCSPGFYKNHMTAWCPPHSQADTSGIVCQDGKTYTCTQLVCLLSAEPPCKSKEPQRAFAKACLDGISPADICTEGEVGSSPRVATANLAVTAPPAATGGCNSTGGSVGWLGLVALGLLGATRARRSDRSPR